MADEDVQKIKEELDQLERELAKSLSEELAQTGRDINEESSELARAKDIDRELARYAAGALDRASTSLVAIGVFTPLIGVLYHSTVLAMMQDQELAGAVVGCLVGAFALHWTGRSFIETGFRR